MNKRELKKIFGKEKVAEETKKEKEFRKKLVKRIKEFKSNTNREPTGEVILDWYIKLKSGKSIFY